MCTKKIRHLIWGPRLRAPSVSPVPTDCGQSHACVIQNARRSAIKDTMNNTFAYVSSVVIGQ